MLQYQVVQNAVDCSSAYYHAIGFLRAASSEVNDASPCLPALENSVYVDYINTFAARYGTMNGIHNVNLDGKDEWNLLYLQGTLKEINTKNENILHESINGEMYYMPRKVAVLTFEITDTFSGHPELIAQKERTFRMDVTEHPDFLETLKTEMKQGSSYFFCAIWSAYYYDTFPGIERVRTIVPLGTVSGLTWAFNPLILEDGSSYYEPVADGELADYFYLVPSGASVDLTDPALAESAKALEYIHANECGASVIPVKDMARLPNFEDRYVLSEGRLLTLEDDAQQNPVCVIRQELAEKRNIKIGDKIEISLKDISAYDLGYTAPEIEDHFFDAPVITRSYTVCGIVHSLEDSMTAKQYSEIYIPNCFYPDDFRNYVDFGCCSFVLRSPTDKEAFLEETGGQLQELGFEAEFVDDGWDEFHASSQAVLQTSRNSMLLLGLLLVLGLLLACFLYQRARRREVAILRTLGIPKGRVLWQALLPIALLGLIGVGGGSAAAYYYGMKKAGELVAALEAAQPMAASFDPLAMVMLGAAVWVLLLVLEAVFLLVLCSRPVLPLLQGGKIRGKKGKG